ncbi:MAG: hypothetical protein P8J32_07025 [bacterium]|nr:hypothetical protein [bacterium]
MNNKPTQDNRPSNNLTLLDKENYILDGTLMVIDQLKGEYKNAKLDVNSVKQTIFEYKRTKVDRGIAYGVLEDKMIQDKEDEISEQEMAKVSEFDIKLAQDWEEEELSEEDIAFQIMDMMFDAGRRRIVGRIHILDTPKGMIARENIDRGLKCYISSSGIEDVVARDKSVPLTVDFAFLHKFQSFKEGWKLSFIGRGGEYGF